MSRQTAVIILNWNGARLLPTCLTALARQSYRDFDLWLVDNGSIDESLGLLSDLDGSLHPEWLSAPLPGPVHMVRNRENAGFAAGNNQVLRELTNPYVVLLNNDAVADPDWLGELVGTAASAARNVGMVASTMLFSNHLDYVASAGISLHRDGVALDRAAGVAGSRLEALGTVPVFGPSAGAALYKKEMLLEVGLFDERFFSYLEDADLAWRARVLGWRALHNPLAKVRHEYSATGGHNSPFKRYLLSRNRVWMLYKNMPEVLLRRNGLAIARYDLLAIVNGLLTRDRHLIRGRLEAVRRLGEFQISRRKITTSSHVQPETIEKMLAPALTLRQVLRYRARIDALVASLA
ncbi:MAG: glycosyltransferase family 2 protein [Chloroflexota bacterium]|nr:glycosyltransferase family 2 protein [Chloroflexota bacterium]